MLVTISVDAILDAFSEVGLRTTVPRRRIADWLATASETGGTSRQKISAANCSPRRKLPVARPSSGRWTLSSAMASSIASRRPTVHGDIACVAAANITTTSCAPCVAGSLKLRRVSRLERSGRSRRKRASQSSGTRWSCLAAAPTVDRNRPASNPVHRRATACI